MWAGAVADQSILAAFVGVRCRPASGTGGAGHRASARRSGTDRPSTHRCGMLAVYDAEVAQPYFAEAIELVRAADDRWSLCQIFSYQATGGRYGR